MGIFESFAHSDDYYDDDSYAEGAPEPVEIVQNSVSVEERGTGGDGIPAPSQRNDSGIIAYADGRVEDGVDDSGSMFGISGAESWEADSGRRAVSSE